MQTLTTQLQSTRKLVLAILMLGAGIGAGIALTGFILAALMPQGAGATHDASGAIHVCVSKYTGQARFVPQGQAPNCNSNEVQFELAGAGAIPDISALVGRLDALEADSVYQQSQLDSIVTAHVALAEQVPDCLSESSGDALFTGCNVQIVNGMGSTDAGPNRTGNLIIGYNEATTGRDRVGSHNLIVGTDHDYTSYGGIVAGVGNQIRGPYASVTGGSTNYISSVSFAGSISGGYLNLTTGNYSSVSGGSTNTASGDYASVSGGVLNEASGNAASVSGGFDNEASGGTASVSGGSGNSASGLDSSVSGGASRVAPGDFDWVAGGQFEDF